MPTYREYSARLDSMGGMRRVTSTMKMVAASHLHRAQAELKRAGPYGLALAALLRNLQPDQEERAANRLLAGAARADGALLVVVTSDRGLCGACNANVQRAARRWTGETRARFRSLRAVFVGRKGRLALQRDIEARGETRPMPAHPSLAEALALARTVTAAFRKGHYDEVYLAHNLFVSPFVSHAHVDRLLPVAWPPPDEAAGRPAPALKDATRLPSGPAPLFEPDRARLLEQALLRWIEFRVFEALLHSVAAEHAARVIAMENATTNLRRLEAELTQLRNRARQASITNELAEIVGGAEALA